MNIIGNIESLKSFFCSELILIFGIAALVFLSLRKTKTPLLVLGVTLSTLILSLLTALFVPLTKNVLLFEGTIALDPFGRFFKILILASTIVAALLSDKSKDLSRCPKTEYFAFLLTLALGLNVMAVSNDLIMIYLSIEMASIISYIMAGYMGANKRSEEAALKYVLYGGMASGIMIFGMSLLYGLTGTLNLTEIRIFLMSNATDRLVLYITFIMIMAGLGYKMAVAPFHMWSPDTYEGAPIPVTAYLSVASKAAGFAVTMRFFTTAFVVIDANANWSALKALDWQNFIAVIAAITMTLGNFVAIHQTNIKRFLAYSSVAHAGYLLMGLAAQSKLGIEGTMFYFIIYFFMNLGAFVVATLVANEFGSEEIKDYKGLAKKNTYGFLIAICFSIFLLSLAGLPPFAGFIGKWYIFSAVVKAQLGWLAVIGVINSVVSLFYYLRVVKQMLLDDAENDFTIQNSYQTYSCLIVGFAAIILYFGIFFGPLVNWTKISANLFY